MEESEGEFRAEPTQIELAKLENALLQAEYRYGKDIAKLQEGLIRARKISILHLVGIHLKMVFLTEFSKSIPLEKALYQWKSKCVTNNASRNKRVKSILVSFYKTVIVRAFYIWKERRMRKISVDKSVEGPVFAQGALSPLSSEDDDLEI